MNDAIDRVRNSQSPMHTLQAPTLYSLLSRTIPRPPAHVCAHWMMQPIVSCCGPLLLPTAHTHAHTPRITSNHLQQRKPNHTQLIQRIVIITIIILACTTRTVHSAPSPTASPSKPSNSPTQHKASKSKPHSAPNSDSASSDSPTETESTEAASIPNPLPPLPSATPLSTDDESDDGILSHHFHALDSDEFEGSASTTTATDSIDPLTQTSAEVLTEGYFNTFTSYIQDIMAGKRLRSYPSSKSSSSSSSSFLSDSWPLLLLGTAAAVLISAGAYYYTSCCSSLKRSKKKSKKPLPPHLQPLLHSVPPSKGRCQSMDWVTENLKKDEDGDEAHEFLGPF